MTAIERLADFLVAARGRRPSEEVLHHAKRAVIDWFGAVIPGGSVTPVPELRRALDDEVDRGRAVLYPSGERAPVHTAALLNGTASHALEVDDILRDAVLHPGCTVIPTALAVARDRGSSGAELLRAVALGYEVVGRIGAAVAPVHYRYWHATGTVGGFGSAAAAATLGGFDRRRTAWALAHAGTLGSGLRQALGPGSRSKPVHAGHAASAGVLAAALAEEGVPGALDLLEGERGFGRAMSDDVDWQAALEGLGEDRYAVTSVTVKAHACCGHAFAAIDAALDLREGHGFAPGDVEGITVGTYAAALEVAGSPDPAFAADARFSLPYLVARALVRGGPVGVDAFTDGALEDPEVRRVSERVTLEVDEELDAAFPARRGARVEVRTRDGGTHGSRRPTRRGDPEVPLDDEALEGKFRTLVSPVLGPAATDQLLERLWSLDGAPDVAVLDRLAP